MLKTNKRPALSGRGWIAGMACLAVAGLLAGCKNSAPPATTTPSVSRPTVNTAAKRLGRSGRILMDTMKNPKTPFHYSYKGQENVNEKYAFDKTAKPQVAAVTLEADISPDEMIITSARGGKKEDHNVKKGDELQWAMAQLLLVTNVTGPTMSIDVVASLASEAGSETVGGVAADKFTIDTATAAGNQKAGFDIAKSILTIKDVKGTAWVAKDSGTLVKFNLDVSRADDRGNTWDEHYEGEVKPK
jgi:hypothetical protein